MRLRWRWQPVKPKRNTHTCILSLSLKHTHTCIVVDLKVLREGKVEKMHRRILEKRMEEKVKRRRYKFGEASGRGGSRYGEQRLRKLGPI